MSIGHAVKRRQVLTLGGAGIVGLLGGGAVTAGVIKTHSASPVQGSPAQSDGPYLKAGTFDQQFLAKPADVKQIWDFSALEQVSSEGFIPIKNAMNSFQFVYRKSFYPVICLRGTAASYALDDTMWGKYRLGSVYAQQAGTTEDLNPLYHHFTIDNGTLKPDDPNSFYQDPSLQALLQRGSSIAVCHDALNGLSARVAKEHGLTAQAVFTDFAAHLVSGAQQTPSGSSLIAVAQHLGFTYAKP